MYAKILLLVLFGSVLVSARPEEGGASHPQPGEKIKNWWHGVETKINGWLASLAAKIKSWFGWDRAEKEKEQRLIKLKEEYQQLQQASVKAIEEKRKKWDQSISSDEREVDQLRGKAESDIENQIRILNEKIDKLIQDGKRSLKTLRK